MQHKTESFWMASGLMGLASLTLLQPAEGGSRTAWFVGGLLVLALVALFLPMVTQPAEERAAAAPPFDARPPAPAPAPPAQVAPTQPDDLTRIEGIGPKISAVLQAAGITTFAALSAADAARLRDILGAADPRLLHLADPTTWPQQAQLAAEGKWDELQTLQDALKGGRRVE